jgi:hypothetical protein
MPENVKEWSEQHKELLKSYVKQEKSKEGI